jgi:hypothetical protein
MNSVDIYINDLRLDLFDDEEISINLSVQNIQDISKVFTDFTQSFTVPATAWNNAIFSHYYRTDVDSSTITKNTFLNGNSLFLSYQFRVLKDGGRVEGGACCADALDELGGSYSSVTTATSFDGRFRQPARIEINSLPFRTGVVQIENVQLKGTEPYAYSITFYGDVVNMTDLFGEDYLYDLDFSGYNIDYTDGNVFNGLTSEVFGELFFPLMSPVKNWIYHSGSGSGAHADNNIAYHTGGGHGRAHGIHYYELKPALKVTAILDAIEAKYGITFTGSFLSAVPFVDLSLWLHRFEGYLFAGGNDINWQLINFNRNTGSGSQFNLATDTWTVPDDAPYDLQITIANASENYEIGVFSNGVFEAALLQDAHPASSLTLTIPSLIFNTGAQVQLFIRPQVATSMTYQVNDYSGIDSITSTSEFSVDQTASSTYSFTLVVSDLMPEIKVRDFLAGILKMYNMVIVPSSPTSFLLQPLEDWYAAGTDVNYQTYFDITEYAVNRPSLYREIEFNYQDTEQILGYEYQRLNNTGFGDLRNVFQFDGDDFTVEVPFECPLFERLTDQRDGTLTNVLCYKSITSEANEDGTFNPYLGAPIVFYGYFDDYDISSNPVSFIDADGTTERIVEGAWYANTSNRYQSAGASHSICFGADIDPYHLQSVSRSLYNNEWSNYITDLYNAKRRIFQLDAVLPVGKILTLDLKNAIVWNNNKYIVNNVKVNMTTGKATFELLNVV